MEGCGHCIELKDFIKKNADKYSNINIGYIDSGERLSRTPEGYPYIIFKAADGTGGEYLGISNPDFDALTERVRYR